MRPDIRYRELIAGLPADNSFYRSDPTTYLFDLIVLLRDVSENPGIKLQRSIIVNQLSLKLHTEIFKHVYYGRQGM